MLFLHFDILSDHLSGCLIIDRRNKVAVAPEFTAPEILLDDGNLVVNMMVCPGFDQTHDTGWTVSWWGREKEMKMIIVSFQLFDDPIVMRCHLLNGLLDQIINVFIFKDLSTIPGDKNDVI